MPSVGAEKKQTVSPPAPHDRVAAIDMPAAPDAELSKLSFGASPGIGEPVASPVASSGLSPDPLPTEPSAAATFASGALSGAASAAAWCIGALSQTVGDIIRHPDAVPGTMVMGAATGAFAGIQLFGISAAGILAPAAAGAIAASVGFYAGIRAYEWIGKKISSLFSGGE